MSNNEDFAGHIADMLFDIFTISTVDIFILWLLLTGTASTVYWLITFSFIMMVGTFWFSNWNKRRKRDEYRIHRSQTREDQGLPIAA